MADDRTNRGAVVLCGGRSSRMGRPKEWLAAGPEAMLQRVTRLVGEAAGRVVVAGRPEQPLPQLPPHVRVVCDGVADFGPLAGMAAGLSALADACEAAFVVGCDHPLLRPALVARMLERLGGFDAVVFEAGGHLRPLPGVYRTSLAPVLYELIAAGEHRVGALARRVRTIVLTQADAADVDADLESLQNVNDQGDLDTLRGHWASQREA